MTTPQKPSLDLRSALQNPDTVYRLLVEAHRGLSSEDSAALNAALVLILANQTGDDDIVRQAISLAVDALDLTRSGGT